MKLPSISLLLIFSGALALQGCAANRYCIGEQPYQRAEDRPMLVAIDGLKLPESTNALRIPAQPPATVPFGTRDAKGDGVCLDKPPGMPKMPS